MRKSNIYSLYVDCNNTISNEDFIVIVNGIIGDIDKLNALSSLANEDSAISIEYESLLSNIANSLRQIKRELPDAIKDIWNKIVGIFKKSKEKSKNSSGKSIKNIQDENKQLMAQANKGLTDMQKKLDKLIDSQKGSNKQLEQLEKQANDLLASLDKEIIENRRWNKDDIDKFFLN